jgi:hypothetical protein
MAATLALAPFLPVTVAVAERGAVLIEAGSRSIAMSPFSERAKRLTLDFGPGTHVIATDVDVADLPTGVADDIADALAN